jgi:hypothetical protein
LFKKIFPYLQLEPHPNIHEGQFLQEIEGRAPQQQTQENRLHQEERRSHFNSRSQKICPFKEKISSSIIPSIIPLIILSQLRKVLNNQISRFLLPLLNS